MVSDDENRDSGKQNNAVINNHHGRQPYLSQKHHRSRHRKDFKHTRRQQAHTNHIKIKVMGPLPIITNQKKIENSVETPARKKRNYVYFVPVSTQSSNDCTETYGKPTMRLKNSHEKLTPFPHHHLSQKW